MTENTKILEGLMFFDHCEVVMHDKFIVAELVVWTAEMGLIKPKKRFGPQTVI